MKNLETLRRRLQIPHICTDRLELAFTHRSASSGDEVKTSYKGLEFIGDKFLGLFVGEYVYKRFCGSMGELSDIVTIFISNAYLCMVADRLGLISYLIIDKDGIISSKTPADIVESLIGLVYLDLGREEAEKFLMRIIVPDINKALAMPLEDRNKQFSFPAMRGEDPSLRLELVCALQKVSCEFDVRSKTEGDYQVVVTCGTQQALGESDTSPEQAKQRAAVRMLGILGS